MALANLEKDLDSIITAIRRPEGGDSAEDPLRDLLTPGRMDFKFPFDHSAKIRSKERV